MTEVGREHRLIRQYLLGQLAEEDQERLEELFMTDGQYREEVLIVEEELIEDFLDDSLSTEDKGRVASRLLSTPEQVQRLEVAKALNRYRASRPTANAAVAASQADESVKSRPTPISLPSFRRKRIAIYALAAVVLVAALAGAWSLLSSWRRPDFSREFVFLNTRQGKTRRADRVVTLFPGTLRGDQSLKISPEGREQLVELNLALGPGQYIGYRVTLRGGNISGEYSVNNLQPTVSDAVRFVPVRVPTGQLAPGDYSLELAGLTAEGTFEDLADYAFRFSN